ncbi:MAG: MBL fold metallo-hydrolase [Selenomonadaceae bacterium]|nr:MBL fold metallo-hydrolase [Selenomonadaceae bacterium]
MSRRSFLKGLGGAILLSGIGSGVYVSQPKFGCSPSGRRLERVLSSPNWDGGKFENYEPFGKALGLDRSLGSKLKAMSEFIFPTKGVLIPDKAIPTVKTDLKKLSPQENVVIWLGHSSIYIQQDGLRILIDPVLSGYASPLPFIVRAFPGTMLYTADDFPDIDLLVISHDHWDHLDYSAVMGLLPKVKQVVCPLGVDGHLVGWGFPDEIVQELDWFEEYRLDDRLTVCLTPSRHFSGRLFKRNQTLWGGFAFMFKGRKLFYSGDGGYGKHFKMIRERLGAFDFALMENGQYNEAWHNVHMFPEETAAAAEEIGAACVIPVHAGKFNICPSAWYVPYNGIAEASAGRKYSLLTPRIGEPVATDKKDHHYNQWWREVK